MKRMAVTALILLAALLVSACASGYSIKIGSGADLIDECPTRAKAGETVTVHTAFIADGELIMSVSGIESGDFVEEGVYQFVMPAEDVTIRASVSTQGYPGS